MNTTQQRIQQAVEAQRAVVRAKQEAEAQEEARRQKEIAAVRAFVRADLDLGDLELEIRPGRRDCEHEVMVLYKDFGVFLAKRTYVHNTLYDANRKETAGFGDGLWLVCDPEEGETMKPRIEARGIWECIAKLELHLAGERYE